MQSNNTTRDQTRYLDFFLNTKKAYLNDWSGNAKWKLNKYFVKSQNYLTEKMLEKNIISFFFSHYVYNNFGYLLQK